MHWVPANCRIRGSELEAATSSTAAPQSKLRQEVCGTAGCCSRRKALWASSSGGLRAGSATTAARNAARAHLPAGHLCRGLPNYCRTPPVSCVVFGFGVSEDGQLVRCGTIQLPLAPPSTAPVLTRAVLVSQRDWGSRECKVRRGER